MRKLFLTTTALVALAAVPALADNNTATTTILDRSDDNDVTVEQIGNYGESTVFMNGSSDRNDIKVQQAGWSDEATVRMVDDSDHNEASIKQEHTGLFGGVEAKIVISDSDSNVAKIRQTYASRVDATIRVRNGSDDNDKLRIKQEHAYKTNALIDVADHSDGNDVDVKQIRTSGALLSGDTSDVTVRLREASHNNVDVTQKDLYRGDALVVIRDGDRNDVTAKQSGKFLLSEQRILDGDRNTMLAEQDGYVLVSRMTIEGGDHNNVMHRQSGSYNTATTFISHGDGNTVSKTQR